MAAKFKPGDAVQWQYAQHTVRGTVVRAVTRRTIIKGHKVNASAEDPQYLVRSERTGRLAIHRPESLKRALED